MPIDMSSHISGGYYLTKLIPRPDAISDLVPDTLLTLSSCFTDIAPDTWADAAYKHMEQQRFAEASKFGIDSRAVPRLVDRFTKTVAKHHITTAFPDLTIAREFYQHCQNRSAVILVGIGLDRSLLSSLYAQRGDDVNHGYGLFERIEDNVELETGGEPLGYEILGYEATKFHSWLCHNSPTEARDSFGVTPNRNGFIDSLDDAVRVTEHLKATGAETSVWEPWLVVRYGPSNKG